MDEKQRHEVIIQYSVVAAIISLILFVAAFFVNSISIETASDSFSENIGYFIHSPIFWIILILVILIPLVAYVTAFRLTAQILGIHKSLDSAKDRMQQISKFTQDLIQENYSVDLPFTDENDTLGKSLIDLRDTLRLNKENENTRREDESKRNWLAEGMAHFSELLRNNVNDLEKLSFLILKDLTKYIDAVQGGFYMLDDSDPNNKFFNLMAFVAYDRRKFADQQIKWGDGLVGTCALEQKTIHMKKVPESYIRITSGLGHSNPRSILLEPMLHENEVYGVLEFATLVSFSPSQINLVERVAKSIGSTLATIKNTLDTAKLLEDSRAQALLLASQEEEMRQNMEELKATQEEAARQTQQYISLENVINQTLIRAELDVNGIVLQTNKLFLEKLQYQSISEFEGKHIDHFVGKMGQEQFKKIWKDLVSGNKHFEGKIKYKTKQGNDLWTITQAAGLKQDNDTISKIVLLAADINEEQQKCQKLEAVTDAINRTGIMMEMDLHGTLLVCNDIFLKLIGIGLKDLNSVTVFDLIDSIETEGFMKRWDSIIKGVDYTGSLKFRSKNEEEKWIQGVFMGINDMHHQIDRVIFVGNDVTNEKFMEFERRNKAQNLKKLEKMLRESEKEASMKIKEAKAGILQKYVEIETANTRNEALLESAMDAIIITGSDNRIILFNKAAEDLWGYPRSEVLHQNIGMLFPDALIESDDFLARYTGPGDQKITGVRKKVNIINIQGNEKPTVFIISKARINNENVYLAMIQNLENQSQ